MRLSVLAAFQLDVVDGQAVEPRQTFGLPRKQWQRALLVIGKYNRG